MSTDVQNSPELDQLIERHRAPVPFARLLRVQFRSWRSQRGILALTCLALALGVSGAAFALSAIGANPTADSVETAFGDASAGFTLLWLALGVLAGAAPFRSGWAALILSVAPRRLRWLTASYTSTIGWALGATAAFGVIAWGIATVLLAGHYIDAPLGVLTAMPHVAAKVVLTVTIGFALGAAVRSLAAPMMVGYLGATALPMLASATGGLSRWFDMETATNVAAGLQPAPHGIAPVVVALLAWTVPAAVIAVVRLQRSDLR
jgi:hypothetical protein